MTESTSIGNIILDFSDFVFIPDFFVLSSEQTLKCWVLVWFDSNIQYLALSPAQFTEFRNVLIS